MLKWWQTHAEYQLFLSVAVTSLNGSQLKRFYSYSDSLDKLTSMNPDPVGAHLLPYYSNTGRPALNQPQILCSFILMMDQGITSLTAWVRTLESDDLLAFMIGYHPDSLPPLGSYYDFINRLWLRNPKFEKPGRKDVFPCNKNKKPSTRPGKDKKLLQELFSLVAIVPSMELGLFPPEGVTVSGDGTCDRHFSDPDAAWGWDSDLKSYYFGFTLYVLFFHNEVYHTDIPLHLRFFDARRHDSVGGLVSLAEFKTLNPDFPIRNLCLDSAHDNYPTYNLCKEWNIIPFIDLNSNRGRPASIPGRITIDTDGTPLCQAGFRMVYWGYCKGRSRCKWRCPVACGKEESCSCKDNCSPSPYGRCIYTKPDWDVRLYPPIARGTEEYKKTYNNRSGSERVNDRILNNYHLHAMKIHRKKRYSFFAMIAGIVVVKLFCNTYG